MATSVGQEWKGGGKFKRREKKRIICNILTDGLLSTGTGKQGVKNVQFQKSAWEEL